MKHNIFIPLNEVKRQTSLSGTSIWREEKKKRFPLRRKISPNRVAWLQSEIQDWIDAKGGVSNDI